MSNPFFDCPVLNSPYAYPARHWELDEEGQPTQRIAEGRRPVRFITPIPKPRKRKASAEQQALSSTRGAVTLPPNSSTIRVSHRPRR